MTKPRQNSSIWSCVRRRRNGKCRRANGARRKPSSPSCSKTGSSWHDGQPAPHTRFLIVPKIAHDEAAIERLFVELFLEAHANPPKQIVLDLDATDDPVHGHQEGRFFHGYYD